MIKGERKSEDNGKEEEEEEYGKGEREGGNRASVCCLLAGEMKV